MTSKGELGMILDSGALIMIGQILRESSDLRVRIAHLSDRGFSVEIANLTDPIVCETAPVLHSAVLAAASAYAERER